MLPIDGGGSKMGRTGVVQHHDIPSNRVPKHDVIVLYNTLEISHILW